MELFLSHPSVDVNKYNKSNVTPLMLAVSSNIAENVCALLEYQDIDLSSVYENGLTQLHLAAAAGMVEKMQKILNRNSRSSTITVDVNKQDSDGYTALPYAVSKRQEECVKMLLEVKEIDVNIRAYDGYTPLHIAVELKEVEIIRLLLTHKQIDVNIPDKFGCTPLALTRKYFIPNKKIVWLLIRHGATDKKSH